MTMRVHSKVQAVGPGRVYFEARLVGAGSSAPTVDEGGRGLTVTRSAQGDYKVTVPSGYTIINAQATMEEGTAGAKTVALTARSSSDPSVTVTVDAGSSDLQSDEYLHLSIACKDVSVSD